MTKAPTIKATLDIIRDLGLSARYAPEYQEFRVALKGRPESAYFTDSRIDAIQTAHAMAREFHAFPTEL